jgi:multiple sugar transport system substrate-binding protein
MKNKKSFWSLIVLILFVFTMIGCTSQSSNQGGSESSKPEETSETPSEGQIELRVAWWGSQARHDRTLEAIKLFEEQNPDIKVIPEFTGWDGYWEKLNTQAAGSNLPDVVQMDVAKLNEFKSRDQIIDLAPYIKEGVVNLSDVEDIYQDINTEGDSVWAVALGANALGTVYNKTLFEKAGIELKPGYTYEDLHEELVKAKGVLGDNFYGYSFFNADYESFFVYVRQNGEQFYNNEGTDLGFDKQTLVNYFEYVGSLLEDGVTPPQSLVLEHLDLADSLVARGEAAVQMAASNQVVGVASGTEDKIGLMILPSLEGGEPGNWIRPSMSFSISKSSKHLEAGAKFIDFMTNSLEANEVLAAERGVPISSKVREHIFGLLDEPTQEQFSFLETLVDYAKPVDPLPPPGETEVRAAFMRSAEAINYGQITPEDAAEKFVKEAREILSK